MTQNHAYLHIYNLSYQDNFHIFIENLVLKFFELTKKNNFSQKISKLQYLGHSNFIFSYNLISEEEIKSIIEDFIDYIENLNHSYLTAFGFINSSLNLNFINIEYYLETIKNSFFTGYIDKNILDNLINSKKQLIDDCKSLTHKIEMKEFEFYFQPIVQTSSNNNTNVINNWYELLLRFTDQDLPILPGKYILAAEQMNILSKIDCHLIDYLFEHLKKHPNKMFNFNLSGHTVTDNQSFKKLCNKLLNLNEKLDGNLNKQLILEITETYDYTTTINNLTHNIQELKKLGFKIAVDDFGDGYNSIRILTKITPDIVKISPKYMDYSSPENLKIYNALIEIIKEHSSESIIVIEGVEDPLIFNIMDKNPNIDYLQGFYIQKPSKNIPNN